MATESTPQTQGLAAGATHREIEQSKSPAAPTNWSVYIIRTRCDQLYTGITTDIQKRWRAHRDGRDGAKYFRGRQPAELLLLETGHTRSSASRREAAIKKLSRANKWRLIRCQPPQPITP